MQTSWLCDACILLRAGNRIWQAVPAVSQEVALRRGSAEGTYWPGLSEPGAEPQDSRSDGSLSADAGRHHYFRPCHLNPPRMWLCLSVAASDVGWPHSCIPDGFLEAEVRCGEESHRHELLHWLVHTQGAGNGRTASVRPGGTQTAVSTACARHLKQLQPNIHKNVCTGVHAYLDVPASWSHATLS